MGEVLRPREGERLYPEVRLHPNHRRSPPSDNHWSRLTHITHNLLDRLHRTAETPLPKSRQHCLRLYSVGTQGIRCPDWRAGYGNGPSVADRGPFSPPAQGGSLLASNGGITEGRPAGVGQRLRVPSKGVTEWLIDGRNQTVQRPRLTRSNSGRVYQVLVKRGHLPLCRPMFHAGITGPDVLGLVRTGPSRGPCAPRSRGGRRPRRPRRVRATAPVRRPGRRPPSRARCR